MVVEGKQVALAAEFLWDGFVFFFLVVELVLELSGVCLTLSSLEVEVIWRCRLNGIDEVD